MTVEMGWFERYLEQMTGNNNKKINHLNLTINETNRDYCSKTFWKNHLSS